MQNQLPPSGWPPGYSSNNNYFPLENFSTSYNQSDVTSSSSHYFTSPTQYFSSSINQQNFLYHLPPVPSNPTISPQNLGNPLSPTNYPTAIPG
jgi:hypothetical protein